MKLITAEELRVAVGEANFADILTLMGTAVELITAPLQMTLKTSLELSEHKDSFSFFNLPVTKTLMPFSCRLTAGFLDMEYSEVVKIAASYEDLDSAEETDKTYLLNRGTGVITFPGGIPGNYMQIQYKSGLSVNEQDPKLYEEVPAWLKQVAILYGNAVYHRLVEQRDHETSGKKGSKPNYNVITAMPIEVSNHLAEHIRWYPMYVSPIYSEVL